MAEDIDKLARSVDDLVKQLSKSAGTFGRLHGSKAAEKASSDGKDSKERSSARKKLWNDFSKNSSNVNYKLTSLSRSLTGAVSSSEGLMHGIEGLLTGIAGGALVTDLLKGSEKLASTYRDLAKNGLTFSGSMLDMASSAAQAGMPLAEFAEMMKHASTTAALLSNNYARTGVSLGSLQAEVRNNLESYGMLGMSLRDIGGLTGDYANTMRLQGHMADMNTEKTGKSISTLALDIANFSNATGVAREVIQSNMTAALNDVAVTSKMWQNNNEGQADALRTSTAFLSSIPGEFGKLLPTMLAQSFGYGSTLLSDGAKVFYEAGAQDFVGVIDDMKTKVDKGSFTAENAGDTFDQLRKVGDQNEEMLRMQAASGNDAARRVLAMIAETRGMSREDFVRKKQEEISSRAFTSFILNIESTFDTLTGAFRTGFYDSVKGLEQSFAALGGKGFISGIMDNLKAFGVVVGGIVMDVFSPENMAWLAGQLGDLGTWLATIPRDGRIVKEWLSYLRTAFDVARPVLTGLFDILGFIADIAAKAGNGFMTAYDAMARLNKTVADVGAALALFLGYRALKWLFSTLMGKTTAMTAAKVVVTAPAVNLSGPVTIHGMGGVGGLGGGRGGAGGTAENLLQGMTSGGLEDRGLGRMGRARALADGMGGKGRMGRLGGRGLHGLLDALEGAGAAAGGVAGKVAKSGLGRAAGTVLGLGGSLAKNMGKGVMGAVVGMATQAVMKTLPDFKGKETMQSMMDYGSTGASVGMMFGPLGALVGAGLGAATGAAVTNWDSISGYLTGKKDDVDAANPNTPSPAGPRDPSQGPEIDALKAKVLELGRDEVDLAKDPNANDDDHKRRMADMQAEIRDCMQAMLQIQSRQSDQLRSIDRTNKTIADNGQ